MVIGTGSIVQDWAQNTALKIILRIVYELLMTTQQLVSDIF